MDAGVGLALGLVGVELGDEVVGVMVGFDGYAVGVLAGPNSPSIVLDGVLWSGVAIATQGVGITVTHAYTGLAAFVNPAARNYHLTSSSAAIEAEFFAPTISTSISKYGCGSL